MTAVNEESGDTMRRNGFILKVAQDKFEVIYGNSLAAALVFPSTPGQPAG
jgi:hypothetical protein